MEVEKVTQEQRTVDASVDVPLLPQRVAQVRVAILGDPQTGKSVLATSLYWSLLQEDKNNYPHLVSAAPDGEGNGPWFQMTARFDPDLALALKELNKGTFSPDFVARVQQEIRSNTRDACVLIGMGGVPTEDNLAIAKMATHAIIMWREEASLFRWRAFAAEAGLERMAELHTSLDCPKDGPITREDDGIMRGIVAPFHRGEIFQQRPVLELLTSTIVDRYAPRAVKPESPAAHCDAGDTFLVNLAPSDSQSFTKIAVGFNRDYENVPGDVLLADAMLQTHRVARNLPDEGVLLIDGPASMAVATAMVRRLAAPERVIAWYSRDVAGYVVVSASEGRSGQGSSVGPGSILEEDGTLRMHAECAPSEAVEAFSIERVMVSNQQGVLREASLISIRLNPDVPATSAELATFASVLAQSVVPDEIEDLVLCTGKVPLVMAATLADHLATPSSVFGVFVPQHPGSQKFLTGDGDSWGVLPTLPAETPAAAPGLPPGLSPGDSYVMDLVASPDPRVVRLAVGFNRALAVHPPRQLMVDGRRMAELLVPHITPGSTVLLDGPASMFLSVGLTHYLHERHCGVAWFSRDIQKFVLVAPVARGKGVVADQPQMPGLVMDGGGAVLETPEGLETVRGLFSEFAVAEVSNSRGTPVADPSLLVTAMVSKDTQDTADKLVSEAAARAEQWPLRSDTRTLFLNGQLPMVVAATLGCHPHLSSQEVAVFVPYEETDERYLVVTGERLGSFCENPCLTDTVTGGLEDVIRDELRGRRGVSWVSAAQVQYVQSFLELERSLSRTFGGTYDQSASEDKPPLLLAGGTLARQAMANGIAAFYDVMTHARMDGSDPAELEQFADHLRRTAQAYVLPDSQQVYRTWGLTYTSVSAAAVPERLEVFFEEMAQRLSVSSDPKRYYSWCVREVDHVIHPLVDGCGRWSRLLGSLFLVKEQEPLPTPSHRESYYAAMEEGLDPFHRHLWE